MNDAENSEEPLTQENKENEDGDATSYDVILCGTDLTQSILSSALSRAGKKVLHCDGNGWYGGLDAVLYGGGERGGGGGASTLVSFIEGFITTKIEEESETNAMNNASDDFEEIPDREGMIKLVLRERYGELKIHSQTFVGSNISRTDGEGHDCMGVKKMTDSTDILDCNETSELENEAKTTTKASDQSVDATLVQNSQEHELTKEAEKEALAATCQKHTASSQTTPQSDNIHDKLPTSLPPQLPHGFAFDLTPSLIYASGNAVEGLIKSGVSDYLEFKSLEGLLLLMAEGEDGKMRSGTSERSGLSGSNKRRSRRANRKSSNDETPDLLDKRGHSEDGDVGNHMNSHSKNTDSKSNTQTFCSNETIPPSLTAYRVPCSKGDVFKSKLLSPIEKRRLMKFLQLISDYGMAIRFGDGEASCLAEAPSGSEGKQDGEGVVSGEVGDSEDGNGKDNGGRDGVKEIGATTGQSAQSDGSSLEQPGASTVTAAETGEEVIHSVNERHLHRGRALSRPQNKAIPSTSDMDALVHCVKNRVDFSEYLIKVAKLPERLCRVVVYALALARFDCLESVDCKSGSVGSGSHDGERDVDMDGEIKDIYGYSTKDGVDDLLRHITSLGRFGNTAFLVPMYGSGELSQAFCRSGAVYGSTYMLRRSPLSISFKANELKTQSICRVSGVTISGEHRIEGSGDIDTADVIDKKIACEHVIIPSTMLPSKYVGKSIKIRNHRRISVLDGKLIKSETCYDDNNGSNSEQRYAIVIPPRTPGLNNKSTIHGVALDDSSFVTPQRSTYTILHLTTSIFESQELNNNVEAEILGKAVQFLIATQSTSREDSGPLHECHHVSFSYTTHRPNPKQTIAPYDLASGLHVCYRDEKSLTCDAAFNEAARIFHEICPESEFLGLAKKVEDAIVYRNNDESDDEKLVLDSAVGIIQTPVIDEDAVVDDVAIVVEDNKDGET